MNSLDHSLQKSKAISSNAYLENSLNSYWKVEEEEEGKKKEAGEEGEGSLGNCLRDSLNNSWEKPLEKSINSSCAKS